MKDARVKFYLGAAALILAVVAAFLAPAQSALAQSPPDSVSGVSVSRADGSVSASWTAPAGASKYHVTYSTDNKQSWSLAAFDHAANSVTISDADNAKTYIVGIRAGNDAGWSGWINSAPAGPYTPPQPPAAVGGVSVSRADGSVSASWTAPAGASKYHVTYSTDNKQSWSLAAFDHAANSVTISGADNAKTYVVGVRAGNDAGWSGWINSAPAGPYTPGLIVQDTDGNAVTSLSVPEGGESSHQVKLATQPAQNVDVCVALSVRGNKDSDITFKGEAGDVVAIKLTFTPENWNTPQTVTIVAAEDDDDLNGARDVGHDARTYYSGNINLTATEVDND